MGVEDDLEGPPAVVKAGTKLEVPFQQAIEGAGRPDMMEQDETVDVILPDVLLTARAILQMSPIMVIPTVLTFPSARISIHPRD
jgi:hypothetical protein